MIRYFGEFWAAVRVGPAAAADSWYFFPDTAEPL